MNVLLALTPSFADRQPMPHLGLACLSAYLAQHGICADILDLNIENRGNWYDPLVITADKFYVDELLDLPLIALWVQEFRRGTLGKKLLDKNAHRDFLLRYTAEFGLAVGSLPSQLHYFNLLALTFSRKLLSYDLVCFSLYRSNMYFSILLALLLREQKPQIKIIAGGPQVSQSESSCRFLLRFGIADAVVRGEGEDSLYELIKAMSKGVKYHQLPGVMTYHPEGEFSFIPRKQLRNLDYLPTPDFSKFTLSRYSPFTLPAYTSRGCSYNCSYCSQKPLSSRLTYRSLKNVMADLALLCRTYRTGFFRFADNLMNADHARLEEFAELLINEKLAIIWQAYFRADITKGIARKLKQAGLEFVTIGAESLSNDVLEHMHKQLTQSENLQAIDTFLSAGISVKLNLIVAHPGESAKGYFETLQHTERLVREYSSKNKKTVLNISVYPFHLIPGSPAYNRPGDFSIMLHSGNSTMGQALDDDLAEFVNQVPVTFSVAGLDSAEGYKRFQVLNSLAEGTASLLSADSLKELIQNRLLPDDRLFLKFSPKAEVRLGKESPSPIELYLPVENRTINLTPVGQTILELIYSIPGLSVGDLKNKLSLACPRTKEKESLNLLATFLHNQIIKLQWE